MSLGKDTAAIFDSHINAYLQQYAVNYIIAEATKEEDYDDEVDQASKTTKKINPLFEKEPLSVQETLDTFKSIDFNESTILKLLTKHKFSLLALLNLYKDLYSRKLSVREVTHKKELGGYRRWAADFERYVRVKLPKLEEAYNLIDELSTDPSNETKIIEIKKDITDTISKAKIDSQLLEDIADNTLSFLNKEFQKKDPSYKDNWISADKLKTFKDNLHTYVRAYKNDINTIVHHNTRLVARIAGHMKDTLESAGFISHEIDLFMEFFQEGARALQRAVHTYDPDRGNNFSTAAWKVVLSAIKEYLFKNSTLTSGYSYGTVVKISKVKKARGELFSQELKEPTPEQIAWFLQQQAATSSIKNPFTPSPYEVRDLLNIAYTRSGSLDEPAGSGEEGDYVETKHSKAEDVNAVIPGKGEDQLTVFKEKIQKLKNSLPQDVAQAMNEYFDFEAYNIKEIAEKILTVRRQLQRMKLNNESFDSEINKYLELYLEVITPVNGITNVGKQALTVSSADITGQPNCDKSITAWEVYKSNPQNKAPNTPWDRLTPGERLAYTALLKKEIDTSNKSAAPPAATAPNTAAKQLPRSSTNIAPLGAI